MPCCHGYHSLDFTEPIFQTNIENSETVWKDRQHSMPLQDSLLLQDSSNEHITDLVAMALIMALNDISDARAHTDTHTYFRPKMFNH